MPRRRSWDDARFCSTVRSPDAVYLPISQWGLPLVRDVLAITLARVTGCTPVLHLHGAQLPGRLAGKRGTAQSTGRSTLDRAERHRRDGTARQVPRTIGDRGPTPRPPLPRRGACPHAPMCCVSAGSARGAGPRASTSSAVRWADSRTVAPTFSSQRRECVWTYLMPTASVDEDFGVLAPRSASSFWSRTDVFVLPSRWVEGLPFGSSKRCRPAAPWLPRRLRKRRTLQPRLRGADREHPAGTVAAFLEHCVADLQGIRRRQQRAWEELLLDSTHLNESRSRSSASGATPVSDLLPAD